ncbi:MAG: hypothetical protein Q8Q23_04730 [bacterium]|nr:hypothetical protein [bacterium]
MTRNKFFLIAVIAAAMLVLPRNARAYLDASTGSYLIQMAIALVAGGLFMFKTFWHRMWLVISRKKKGGITKFNPRADEPNQADRTDERIDTDHEHE